MAKGIISGIVNDLIGGVISEMGRQIGGGKSKKSSSTRPLTIRNYRITHNHLHLHLRKKKSPFSSLYKEIKKD